ncbi:UNVERIFIED_ORG: hypothetical protein M2154_003281 [Enterobacter sp. JUb101]|nr:hypothetical protein [Lelliottia amnigena]
MTFYPHPSPLPKVEGEKQALDPLGSILGKRRTLRPASWAEDLRFPLSLREREKTKPSILWGVLWGNDAHNALPHGQKICSSPSPLGRGPG